PPAEEQAVLEPDADMAAHDRAHGGEGHLMAPGAERRELIVPAAEQAIRGGAHQQQALRLRSEAAQVAQGILNEQRTLHETLLDAMREVVQLAHVVADELEPDAILIAELGEDGPDVAERIPPNPVFGAFHVRLLPGMLPADDAACRLVEGNIHRAHVERAEFRLGLERISEPILERFLRAAARRDVDDRVGRRGYDGDEFLEN